MWIFIEIDRAESGVYMKMILVFFRKMCGMLVCVEYASKGWIFKGSNLKIRDVKASVINRLTIGYFSF